MGYDKYIWDFIKGKTIDYLKLVGRSHTVNSVAIKTYLYDGSGKIAMCSGLTVPTDGSSGYAKGCIFLKTNAGAGSVGVYYNDGTTTSSDFNVAGTIGALSVDTGNIVAKAVTLAKMNDLAEGSILVGGAANAVTAVVAKTSGQILVGDGTDLNSVAVSGDVTLSSAGAVAIAAGKVTPLMMKVLTPSTEANDAAITVLAATLLQGYMKKTNLSGPQTVTTDTAAAIQSAFVATTGAWFDWIIVNSSSQTITLTGGVSVTLKGTAALTNNKVAKIRFINTGAGTIDAIILQS